MKLSGLRIRLFVALLAAGTVAAQQKSIRPSEPNSPGQVPIATPQGADGKVANPPKQDEPLPGGYYRVGGSSRLGHAGRCTGTAGSAVTAWAADAAANADFRTGISAPGSGPPGSAEFEMERASAPPGDGGVGGEAGVAEDGRVSTAVDLDGDAGAGADDLAGGAGEAALQSVGGGLAVVAGQAQPERGGEGPGQDAQDYVEVDVEVDGGGQGVGAERLDDLGEALPGGHPAAVLLDQGPGGDLVVVADDDGGGVAARAGDDQLADGARVAGEFHPGGLVHGGLVVASLPVRPLICRMREGERIRRVANLTPRSPGSPSTCWVVTFWSMISMRGSDPDACFQWSQNAMTSRFWEALVRSALAQARLWVPESRAKKISTLRDRWDR